MKRVMLFVFLCLGIFSASRAEDTPVIDSTEEALDALTKSDDLAKTRALDFLLRQKAQKAELFPKLEATIKQDLGATSERPVILLTLESVLDTPDLELNGKQVLGLSRSFTKHLNGAYQELAKSMFDVNAQKVMSKTLLDAFAARLKEGQKKNEANGANKKEENKPKE